MIAIQAAIEPQIGFTTAEQQIPMIFNIIPALIAKEGLIIPAGSGRSGRSFVSMSKSNTSLKMIPLLYKQNVAMTNSPKSNIGAFSAIPAIAAPASTSEIAVTPFAGRIN